MYFTLMPDSYTDTNFLDAKNNFLCTFFLNIYRYIDME